MKSARRNRPVCEPNHSDRGPQRQPRQSRRRMLYESLEARHLLTASIEGLVFADSNQDGLENNAEAGIAGVTVYADLNTNGARDAGEPFTQTTADDPGTPGVDELGRYVLGNLSEQTHHVTIELSANTRQTAPLSPATGSALTLFENAPRPLQNFVSGPTDVQVSPDGRFVVVGWDQGQRVTTYARRAQDGQLTYQADFYSTTLYGIRRSVFSPDGRFLYVPAGYSDAINVLQMNSLGALSMVQSITISDDANLDRVYALALAPDGSQLFATSSTTQSMLVYNVDASAGTLSLAQTFTEGVDGVVGMNFPQQPRVSPDGTLVAVATQASGGPLTFLDRDPATGVVALSGTSLALGSNRDVIFSDDGRFLYVADFNGRLWTLTRDEVTGDVQVQGSLDLGSKRLDKLVMRPDQSAIYATSSYTDSLLAFDRDPISGAVTLNQTLDSSDVRGMEDAEGVAISPDGQHLYLASQASNRLQTFWTNPTGRSAIASLVTTVDGQSVTNIHFAVSDASPQVTGFSTTSVSPEPADQVDFTLVFDEAVSGVDVGDFQLFNSGLADSAITSVSGGPTDYTITVTTPGYAGNLQLQLIDDDTIVDANAIPLGGIGTGAVVRRTAALHVDSLPPQVAAIAAAPGVAPLARQLSFFVTFDEPVSGVDVTDFQSVDGAGAVGNVDAVVATSDASVYRVDVSVTGTAGSIALALVDDDTIVDVAANPLGDVGTAGSGSGDGSVQSSVVMIDDATISGRVWVDANADGLSDLNESGQVGITVYADRNANGSRDAGEPSVVTQDDDPATTEIDETGMYTLTGLAAVTTYELRVDATQYRQTAPVSYAQDDGLLSFTDSVFGGVNSSDTLFLTYGITLTRDGKQLYALSPNGNKVSLFNRASVSDPFVFDRSWSDTSPGFSELGAPRHLIFGPDEGSGYLIADNTIFVVGRDRATGELSVVDTVQGTVGEGNSFERISSAAISPDGKFLYTAGIYSDTVSAYRIDVATGLLQPIQELRHEIDGVDGLDNPNKVQVSPDGSQLFVSAFFSSKLTVYNITPGSGRLVESQFFSGLSSSSDIAFSPDGQFAYSATTSSGSDKIRVFRLIAGQWVQQAGGAFGLNAPHELEISADGRFVYVADKTLDAVVTLSRDTQTGELTSLQVVNDVAPHDALNGVEFVKLSPDGRELFAAAASDHSLTRFTRLGGDVTSEPHVITTARRETMAADFGIRILYPSATSLSSAVVGPVSDPTVSFTATFDEPVTGVQPSDFVIESTGISGASVLSVTGGPMLYDVLVNTGSGDGTLRLRLIDDDSILNAAAYPLGGTGLDNGGLLSDPISIVNSGSISGRLVVDTDEDGFGDLGEPGLAGATVFVDINTNGQFDSGEPVAMTAVDDPVTTTVDESGAYRISGVGPGSHSVMVIPPAGFALTNPATRSAGSGVVTLVQSIKDGTSGANYLDEAAGVTTSPDGNYLYVASYNDDSVTVFARTAATEQLTVVQQVVENIGGVAGLLGAQSIAISEDGESLYVASSIGDSLVMFDRDPSDGTIAYLGRLRDGFSGADGLNNAVSVQISKDGRHVYVAAIDDSSVAVFTRDASTGLLTFAQKLTANTAGAFAVEISPDQRHVYVSGQVQSGVTVYDRDSTTGLLTLKQTVRQTDSGVNGLSGASGISMSPDGKNLYVAGYFNEGLAVLDRDLVTGELSFNEFVPDPSSTATTRPISVLVSRDGHHVVAMYEIHDAIVIYNRDSATGKLTTRQVVRDGFGGVDGLNGAWDAEFSNDDEYLYVVGAYDDAVVAFDRDAGPWVATNVAVEVLLGETSVLAPFAAVNLIPAVDSVQYSGTTPANQSPITIDVTFSEPVTGFDLSDISLGGNVVSANVVDLSGSGADYVVTITVGEDQGTLELTILDNDSIVDVESVPLGGPGTGNGQFSMAPLEVDLLDPSVVSITAGQSSPTAENRIDFTIDFNEPVTGVLESQFSIVGTSADASITSFQASSTIPGRYYVEVYVGSSLNSEVGLRFNDDDTVVDAVGKPVGGTGIGNGDFDSALIVVDRDVSISGVIWDDVNRDSIRDVGEPGIANVTVYVDLDDNGQFDAGTEPSQVSASDDPATTTIDETGQYTFDGLTAGFRTVRLVSADPNVQQSHPSSGRAFPAGQSSLGQPLSNDDKSIVASDDGKFLYVADEGTDDILVYRIADDGAGIERIMTIDHGNDTNKGFREITLSPDQKHLYVTGYDGDNLGVFDRDAETGVISHRQTITGGGYLVEVSPDGRFVYTGSSAIKTFTRDAVTGELTYANQFFEGFVRDRRDLAIDPSSGFLYTAVDAVPSFGSIQPDLIEVFSISAVTGELTRLQVLSESLTGDDSLDGVHSLAISSDGQFLYAGAQDDDALTVYSRGASDGLLQRIQVVGGAPGLATAIKGPEAIALSSDGSLLYVVGTYNMRLAILDVDQATGRLTLLETFGQNSGAPWGEDMALTDANPFLYATSDRFVSYYRKTEGLRVAEPHIVLGAAGGDYDGADFGLVDLEPNVVIIAPTARPREGNATAQMTVTFSEPVTGVDVTDFILEADQITGSSVQSVSGSGAEYFVTIVTGTPDFPDADRTLTLRVVDDETIIDNNGNSLSGPTTLGTDSVRSIPLVLDQKPPQIEAVARLNDENTTGSLVRYRIAFDENVFDTVDAADFQLIATGLPDATIQDITRSGNQYTINVATGLGTGTIELQLAPGVEIQDLAGNPLSAGGFGDASVLQTRYIIERDPTGYITGKVFDDANGNGILDGAESVAVGQTVFVDANHNGVLDTGESSTLTEVDGTYTLGPLFSGLYDVTLVVPVDDVLTAPAIGGRPIVRASLDSAGRQIDVAASNPSTDRTGTRVAFDSLADNLVAGDGPGRDVFVRDLQSGQIQLVSVAHNGLAADGDSSHAVVSDDGQFVVFYSTATNLVENDTNGFADIFLRDLVQGKTERISVAWNGDQGDGPVGMVSDIDSLGRYVAFSSHAENLHSGDVNGFEDIFLFDRVENQLTLASLTSNRRQSDGPSHSPSVSTNGGRVAFLTSAPNLTGLPSVIGEQVVVRAPKNFGSTTYVSKAPDDSAGNGTSYRPSISNDAMIVAYVSDASNLVAGDSNGQGDAFIYDFISRENTVISRRPDGTAAGGATGITSIDENGELVAFVSNATGLVPWVDGSFEDVFNFHRSGQYVELVSADSSASPGQGDSYAPSVSADGSRVVFASVASNLVTGDTNGLEDLFSVDTSLPLPPVGVHRVTTSVLSTLENIDLAFSNQPPSIVSIDPAVTSTRLAAIDFTVTLTEPVTGLDATDFAVDVTGTASANIASITGADDTYTVSLSLGTGQGTLVLRLIDDDSIIDAEGMPLGRTGSNGGAESVPVIVDNQAPTLVSITKLDPDPTGDTSLRFAVTFDEPVVGLQTTDFLINAAGVTGGQISNLTGTDASYVVSISHNGDVGTIGIDFVDDDSVLDALGNPVGGAGNAVLSGPTYSIETGAITGAVYFDHDRSGTIEPTDAGLSGQTLYIDLNGDGDLDSGEPTAVTTADDPATTTIDETGRYRFEDLVQSSYLVRWLGGAGWVQSVPSLGSGVAVDLMVKDGPAQADFALSNQVPEVLSITTSQTEPDANGKITYQIVFDQDVVGVDTSDFVVGSVEVAGMTISSVSGGPSSYDVTVDFAAASGQGDIALQLNDDDSIRDLLNAPLGGVGTGTNVARSLPLFVDFQPPTVLSIVAVNAPLLDLADLVFQVTFSEPVSGVDAADFAVALSGVSGTSILSVTPQSGNAIYEVVLDSGVGDGTIELELIDDDTIVDSAGHLLGGTGAGNGSFVDGDVVLVERFPRRSLSGHIFFDTDGDGVRDPGETGVPAAGVYLDLDNDGQRDANEPVGTAASDDPQTLGVDEAGFYRFGSLELGQYILRVRPDLRWIDDINNFTAVTLELSTTEAVADLGVIPNLATINGLVYDDLNRDGVLDAGEPGLAGWTLYIDDNGNDQLDTGERTIVTSADDPLTAEDETGRYSFSPLEFQTHRVQLVGRPEFFSTSPTFLDRTIAGGTSV
ncbi:beta-propeller fold lactonase family protein, partial [Stieleria sp.]|uniref:beta-propeller fold lactonase family protein n=1 Tax=Stieleria sp. TaxID=2795976 RepID=UPI0035653509